MRLSALGMLVSLATTLWSPPRDRRLNVLIYHRVRPERDPLFPGEPDSATFDRCMAMVADNFNCLPLDQAVDMLATGKRLPERAVSISFDDGYADNHTEAMPILKRHGLTATFFVASGFLDGGCMWNDEAIELLRGYRATDIDLSQLGLGVCSIATMDERQKVVGRVLGALKYREPEARREALAILRDITGGNVVRGLMMTPRQVVDMRNAGMGIGGHTLSHPILARIDDATVRREIGEDRERLAEILGHPPPLFAFPNGKPNQDYRSEHAGMVKAAGYRAAFSTAWGCARPGIDLFQIPRFTPWDASLTRFALRLAHNYTRSSFPHT